MSNELFQQMLEQAGQVGAKLLSELSDIRKEHGEKAYRQAVSDAIAALKAQGPRGEAMARSMFKDVDFDSLPKPTEPVIPEAAVEEAPPPPPDMNQTMAQTIMSQIPGLRTQAQFNVTMASFDVLRLYLSAIFTGDKEAQERAKKALDGAFLAAEQATKISNNLRDVPEAAKGGEEFRKAPAEASEFDTMKALLVELDSITTHDAFTTWYQVNRKKLDDVKSQSLRNTLFDAIRAKKSGLVGQSS